MDLVILKIKPRAQDPRFGPVENYEKVYRLQQGLSLAAEFPADAALTMIDDFPTDGPASDFACMIGNLLVVSERARAFLEGRGAKLAIEYLPVSLKNPEGVTLNTPYWIANLLRVVDGVDRDKTKHRPNRTNPKRLNRVSNLTLIESQLPTDVELFRLQDLAPGIVATRELANAMQQAELTGIEAVELAAFKD